MNDKKNSRLEIRLSAEEKKTLASKAMQCDKSIAQYVRDIALEKKIATKLDIQTLIELKRIGNNLNQIAKHLNTIPHEDNVRNMLDEIDIYLNQLFKISSKLV